MPAGVTTRLLGVENTIRSVTDLIGAINMSWARYKGIACGPPVAFGISPDPRDRYRIFLPLEDKVRLDPR